MWLQLPPVSCRLYLDAPHVWSSLFFFNDTATTEIYTLSLHDALPICHGNGSFAWRVAVPALKLGFLPDSISTDLHVGSMNSSMKDMLNVMDKFLDRKSTRLNSSH